MPHAGHLVAGKFNAYGQTCSFVWHTSSPSSHLQTSAPWQLQGVSDGSVKFLLYHLHKAGIGSKIHVLGAALAIAMSQQRVLVVAKQSSDPFMDDWCEGANSLIECYFEDFTSCPSLDNKIDNTYNQSLDQSTELFLQIGLAQMLESSRLVPPQMTEILRLSPVEPNKYFYWWRCQASNYIVRLNTRTQADLKARRSRLFPQRTIPPGTISIHVRHGDKGKEAALTPDEMYLQLAPLLLDKSETLRKTIFLSTEDSQTVEYFTKAKGWNTFFVEVDRFTEHSISPLQHADKIGRSGEFLNSMLNLQLALECDAWIGTMSSNWCRLIDELRSTQACKSDGVFLDAATNTTTPSLHWKK